MISQKSIFYDLCLEVALIFKGATMRHLIQVACVVIATALFILSASVTFIPDCADKAVRKAVYANNGH